MQFRLVYQGRLRSNGDSRHKQEIRRALQPQLRELWTHPPLDRTEISLDHPAPPEGLSVIHPVGVFWFAPLICEEVKLLAELEVTMLRPTRPGGLIRQGGDIDNQLKTLFGRALESLRSQRPPKEMVQQKTRGRSSACSMTTSGSWIFVSPWIATSMRPTRIPFTCRYSLRPVRHG